MRVGVVPRLRRRARARRRPRDDVPGGVVRLDRVSCVGHAGHALLPGVRREPEPVGACARGLGRGPCADRAEGGVMPYG